MITQKYIFLDIDGVFKRYLEKVEHEDFVRYGVDQKCVNRINKIIEETGADIIVTSCLRKITSLEDLQGLFIKWGIKGNVIDKTGTKNTRGEEVNEWMRDNSNGPRIVRFVILDDENDGFDIPVLKGNFIKTNFFEGITDQHVEIAIEILNRDSRIDYIY